MPTLTALKYADIFSALFPRERQMSRKRGELTCSLIGLLGKRRRILPFRLGISYLYQAEPPFIVFF